MEGAGGLRGWSRGGSSARYSQEQQPLGLVGWIANSRARARTRAWKRARMRAGEAGQGKQGRATRSLLPKGRARAIAS